MPFACRRRNTGKRHIGWALGPISMDELDKIKNTYTGAIALIDILGYGNILCKNSIEFVKDSIIDSLIRTIETANSIVNRDRLRFNKFANNNTEHTFQIEYLFFSDSFLLYVETDKSCSINSSEHTLNSLCYALCLILALSFEKNIALRGAVSYGEFYIKKDPVIIIGKVITELARIEKSQQWAGIVLSDSLRSFNYSDQFVRTYLTPFKGKDNSREMKVIDWLKLKTIDLSLIDFDKLFDSELEDVKEKKQNTIRFYNTISKQNTGPNKKI